MAERVQIKASTRRTKSGKVVTVRSYDQNRDSVGDTLKTEGRVPTASTPGSFPNGRSTPTTPRVAKYEAQRQEEELRAAQIRARMAQARLDKILENMKDETGTVTDNTLFHSIVSQLDALIAEAENGADAGAEGAIGGGSLA